MISELPEQLIAQAESLIRDAYANEASVRRSVSCAYYALFHLLIRDAIANWRHVDHHARLARTFEHKRMRDASLAVVKDIGNVRSLDMADHQHVVRFNVLVVAETFVDLQQARGRADYDIGESFDALDAAADVAKARLAFLNWAEVRHEPLAQRYLYSLLFKERQ